MSTVLPTLSKISDNYSVSPQITVMDIADIAAAGFVAVVCNRPDDEDSGQPSAADISSACEKAGISFHHIPVSGMPIDDELIRQQREIIDNCGGPVLAYCRSGQRSFVIWRASS